MKERLQKQLGFIREIDKIKLIFRKTFLFDKSRHENDAEHSWHLAIMALLLYEYSNEPVDVIKMIKMVLIHDIVEIDAGDTMIYEINYDEKIKEETKAAKRIFGLLPNDQKDEFIFLWQEFEKRESAEARFAAVIDRLEPIMQNYYTEGIAWKKHKIRYEQVIAANCHLKEGSNVLWEYAKSLIDESKDKGYLL